MRQDERAIYEVPAVPLRAPIDVRWLCHHLWTPHIHPNGGVSHVDFDCLKCGASTEAGALPKPGYWRVRRWLALRLFPLGRYVK